MATIGICRLCGEQNKELQKSHFMPAAAYGSKKRYEFMTGDSVGVTASQIKDRLLCDGCEYLFQTKGEDEVMGAIAGKSAKRFPLHERLRVALPRESDSSVSRFAGYDVDLDMDKFAYFALSIVWRGAVHDWTGFDGSIRLATAIGAFEPPIRQYLLGKAPFPPDTAVIVIVSSDEETRKWIYAPQVFVEENCLGFKFVVRGVFFRVMMGRHMTPSFHDDSCHSPRKCIFYGDGGHKSAEWKALMDARRKLVAASA